MMKTLPVLFVCLMLSGCAATNEMMVDPKTGMTQNCSAFGFGIIGVPIALAMQAECEKNLKAAGYVTANDFQKAGGKISQNATKACVLKVESDPAGADIYSGPDKDTVKTKVGKTPYQLNHPAGGSLWAKECYRATKDGYFDSDVACFDPSTGDRLVSMKLTSK